MMTTLRRTTPWWTALAATAALGCGGATDDDPIAGRVINPSALELTWPAALGDPRRPVVEFEHGLHVKALDATPGASCASCHPPDDAGEPIFLFQRRADPPSRDALMDHYHQGCMDCHAERSASVGRALPMACGECHVERDSGVSTRAPMRFDYSLHARHVAAHQDKCDGCHHVYDEPAKKLVYAKGKESACADCHGETAEGSSPSLRNASHTACVSCHLGTIGKAEIASAPWTCAGCHDAESRAKVKKLATVPRLLRGQPDRAWLQTAGAESGRVAFDHALHEPLVASCSTCHHQTLAKCSSCHTLTGEPKGGGVTLAAAQHDPVAAQSCVGCHRQTTGEPACAGCHDALPSPPGPTGCRHCHTGANAAAADDAPVEETESAGTATVGATPSAAPPPPLAPVELPPLPAFSPDFPERLTLGTIAEAYRPSALPHGKIVATLDRQVRKSVMARRFHGDNETLCAGCHHHSPTTARPPPCRSCHGGEAYATRDQPSLQAAYHRQCIGCHESMKIDKLGCTDCHAEATPAATREANR